eukprot:GCRY01002010.1.p1 GENE.GCRY01002010.1~~GCRY01002010.1.p1  ORF type:complete len:439 (+),score=97.56 GCRY01002010.1:222-1538(+)
MTVNNPEEIMNEENSQLVERLRKTHSAIESYISTFRKDLVEFEERLLSFGNTENLSYSWITVRIGKRDVLGRWELQGVENYTGVQLDKYKRGIDKFNSHWKKGVEFMYREGFIARTTADTARFFKYEDGLSKKVVGEYLGERKEFNVEVLENFVKLFDFAELSFDEALRRFLASFVLPGEAQKIDRMMQCFATQYVLQNPTVFDVEDTAYILAFSLIMLNTDQHNPSVKNKMSVEDFIRNNRGIGKDGANLPREFLADLYNNVSKEQFELPSEESGILTFFNPEHKGFLKKQGGRVKTWKTRWFLLTGNVLYYFKSPDDEEPCGIIPLEDLRVRPVESAKYHLFEIYHPADIAIKSARNVNGRMESGHHTVYRFMAKTQAERDLWMETISNNTRPTPLFELMQKKKEGDSMNSPPTQVSIRDEDDWDESDGDYMSSSC